MSTLYKIKLDIGTYSSTIIANAVAWRPDANSRFLDVLLVPVNGGGGGGGTLQFNFNSPTTSAVVNHNLNRAVSVEVFTSGGVRMIADVQNVSLNQTIVNFDSPQSCYVLIN